MMKVSFFHGNKLGFTLAEILISALILVIASAGLFASFIAANRYVNMSKRRMAAVNLARQITESLYTSVRADTWNSSSNVLACDPTYPCQKTYSLPDPAIGVSTIEANNPLNGFSPSATLDISLVGGDPNTSPRSVSVKMNWNE